jgi:hypothetical protein
MFAVGVETAYKCGKFMFEHGVVYGDAGISTHRLLYLGAQREGLPFLQAGEILIIPEDKVGQHLFKLCEIFSNPHTKTPIRLPYACHERPAGKRLDAGHREASGPNNKLYSNALICKALIGWFSQQNLLTY